MSYPIEFQNKAISLRKKGYSIKEIAILLNIAKSTSSLWLRNILLPLRAQERLKQRKILGQYKSIEIARKKRIQQQLYFTSIAKGFLRRISLTPDLCKLCCALIFWCEGSKNNTQVKFTNSDPSLIKVFLDLLRHGFKINESKFRVLMHLHEYHKEERQKVFWNKITKIPLNQFHKSYLKPHTSKRKHLHYPGCITVTYYDARVAKELTTIYNTFAQRGVR
ncbi:hypothetical protein HYS95_02460 [Candidatus Daviesbacteria bacterium]|nr:hypothetical protein [Candidatus Daviesbacteria bacterium]